METEYIEEVDWHPTGVRCPNCDDEMLKTLGGKDPKHVKWYFVCQTCGEEILIREVDK